MAIRKTDSGIEMTHYALGIAITVITLLGMVVSTTAAVITTHRQIADATPVTRHDSLVAAVGRHDGLFRELQTAIDSLHRDVMALNCHTAGYPSPFCDDVPRTMQAGTARGAR